MSAASAQIPTQATAPRSAASSGSSVELASAAVRACVVAALVSQVLAIALLIAQGRASDPLHGAWLGAACVAGAAWPSVLIARATRGKPAAQIPMLVLVASATRMMLSLVLAILVFFVLTPPGLPFWGAFLAAGMLALTVETGLIVSALKKHNAATPSPIENHA